MRQTLTRLAHSSMVLLALGTSIGPAAAEGCGEVSITGGGGLGHMALDPIARRVIVSTGHAVSIVDLSFCREIGTVPVAGMAWAVGMNPGAGKAYVASYDDATYTAGFLSVIELATFQVLGTRVLDGIPGDVSVNPRTGKVYVGLNDDEGGAILVLDGSTLVALNEIRGLGYVYDMDFDPLRNRIAAAGGDLVIIDGATDRIVERRQDSGAFHVAIDPFERVIVTAHRWQSPGFGAQSADEIDGYRLVHFWEFGVIGFAINPVTRHVHVNTFSDWYHFAVVQDYEGNHVGGPFDWFGGPLVVDPIGGFVYVASGNLFGYPDGPPPRLPDKWVVMKALLGTTGN